MTMPNLQPPPSLPFRAARRPIRAAADWVHMSPLLATSRLPLLINPAIAGVDLIAWMQQHREQLQTLLHQHGGILFRQFKISSAPQFEQVIQAMAGELMEYRDRSSPRSAIAGKIYTSTDHPATQSIFLHSENSYAATWPLKLFFGCLHPAQQGGETPIADTRRLLQRIDPAVRDRFHQKQVMYVRNFGDGMGLPWQTVFQTTEPTEVEDYAQRQGIELEWKSGGRLRTRQVRQAIAQHPHTQEWVWFNHAVFFHISTQPPALRETLLATVEEADLPYNTYYGDGSPIEPDVLNHLRAVYQQETVLFPWQAGDVLMLDNMLTAHGRQPFVGNRQVVVGMAEPFSLPKQSKR